MTAVAERAMALIDVCDTSERVETFSPMLAAAWQAAEDGRRPTGTDQFRRFTRLTGMDDPDSEEPDDDAPAYLIDAALGALYAALWVAFRDDPYDSAPADVGPDTFSALDGVVQFTRDPRPVMVDPRNPPPPGPFEARERAACSRDMKVATALPQPDAVARSRTMAREQRATLRADVRVALRGVRAFDMEW
jgi:hypothetical protein